MKVFRRATVVAIAASIVAGCSAPKLSSVVAPSSGQVAVSSIAISPGGGIVADAVGSSLAAMGFGIVDAGASGNIIARSGLSEAEISSSRGLDELRAAGIDAVLKVRTSNTGSSRIDFATAQIFSTKTRKLIASTSLQNSRAWSWAGGRRPKAIGYSSLIAGSMQMDIVDIGDAIAKELGKSIKPSS